MLKKKTSVPYWTEFAQYQSFASYEDLKQYVKDFEAMYSLTKTMKAVLNTIKLYSKRYSGVCWLFREEIAAKSSCSVSSVDRALQAFKEIGLIRIIQWFNNKRGGQSHNIYVINSGVDMSVDNIVDNEACDEAIEGPNEEAVTVEEVAQIPCGSKAEAIKDESHKNLNNNSNNNSDTKIKTDNNDNNALQNVPKEFVEIMKPYYGHSPEIILARWKSTCVSVKRWCIHFGNTSWERIGEAWKTTVKKLKQGSIRNKSDDGIGGYYYEVLSSFLVDDYADAMRGIIR